MTFSEDIAEQTEMCLQNIEWALSQAGSSLKDVVRVHDILPNKDDWPACWPILRQVFGDIRPAATMIEAGLSDSEMKIEIELTALRQAL